MLVGSRPLQSTVFVCLLFDVCGNTGSLASLSGMTQMTTLSLLNNQLTGVSPGVCCIFDACLSDLDFCDQPFPYRLLQYFLMCGDTGSLAPLSGMTQMTNLELSNNRLTGSFANLL
jgi:hypothetical protein